MIDTKVDRATYLGSHDIAAIMGDHPFLTKMGVFLNKTGKQQDQDDKPWLYWGNELQRPILKKYCEKEGLHSFAGERFKRHDKYPCIGSTPDTTIADLKKSVDAKNVRYKDDQWGEEYTDEVPRYVLWQAHCHMTTWDHDVCDIPVLFSGCDHQIFRIERNEDISEAIIEIAVEFWRNHVLANEPPDFDGSEATYRYLRKKFPSHTDELRPATEAETALIEAMQISDQLIKDTENASATMKQKLQGFIGTSMGLTSEFGKVTWKEQKGATRIDSKLVKALYPEVFQECSKTGDPVRVFRKAYAKK